MTQTTSQIEYFGIGCLDKLNEILSQEGAKKIFLVTGNSSYQLSGAQDKINPTILKYPNVRFTEFSENPKIEDIEKGIAVYQKEKCNLVMAVGGGSVIDTAKAISLLAVQDDAPLKYVTQEKKLEREGVPLIAIPTTSGSGSEATSFAVIYVNKKKYSLYHPQLVLPKYALIDPSLTFSLPRKITASTGMDALSQAIESYWSVNSSPLSKEYSAEAITLIIENLEEAVNLSTPESKIALSKGSNLAGKAINLTATTSCHAISYPFTSYFSVPHGHAVALTLGQMAKWNYGVRAEDCQDPRGPEYVKRTMEEIFSLSLVEPEHFPKRIDDLLNSIGLERNIVNLGIKGDQELAIILKNVNPERIKNNPRKIDPEDLKNILHKLM